MHISTTSRPNPRVAAYERAWGLLTRTNALHIRHAGDEAAFARLRAALTHRIRRHFGLSWALRQQRVPDGWVVWAEESAHNGSPVLDSRHGHEDVHA